MTDQAAADPVSPDPPDNEGEDDNRRSLLGKIILAVLLVVILIILLTTRSCSFLNLATFVPPASGTDTVEDCLSCHPDRHQNGSAHAPEKVPCLRCHTQHPAPNADGTISGEGPFLIATQRELCVICHGSVGAAYDDQHQHPPFQNGECTACHDPHGTDFPKLLVRSAKHLCVTCHFVADSAQHEQVHAPFGDLDCIACHSPHASDYTGMTKAAQPDLCLDCHTEIDEELTKRYLHSPAGEECTTCHLPHFSDDTPLLQAKPPALCYRCHTSVQALFKLDSRHPVPGEFNCTSCHFVHGSDFRKLLHGAGNDVCRECHAVKVVSVAKTAHDKVSRSGREKGSCLNCHMWHGSSYGPLLPKREVPLCAECHERKTHLRTNHPHDAPYYDTWHKQTMRCSSCHDPHGSGFTYMVRKEKDGLCLTCHPGVGITF
ncbi:MAG: cytochrome c3 family protein [Actinobacteria bacterium]|nr:cytochrome c3 family protein [Actinomycetota bacterium]